VKLRNEVLEQKRQSDVQILKAEANGRELMAELRLQIERLENDSKLREDKLKQAQLAKSKVEDAKLADRQEHERRVRLLIQDNQTMHSELESKKEENQELTHMLDELHHVTLNSKQ